MDRGLSDVFGYVLLAGMVVGVAVVVVALGAGAIGGFQGDVAGERTDTSMQLLDARLGSLGGEGVGQVALDVGTLARDGAEVVQSGSVTLAANGNASCRASVPLSSIRTDTGAGTLVYEAGGLWRLRDGSSTMVSPPSLTYENGSLGLTLANLSGTYDATPRARLDAGASAATTSSVLDSVFHDTCLRPDNFTLTVTSDLHGAWADYLQETVNATSVTPDPENESVEVFFDSSHLPEALDDSRNDVVDLQNSSQVTFGPGSITVGKGANNTYRVVATPMGTGPKVSHVQVLEGEAKYRTPMDVTLVLDESGSMGNDGKMPDAKDAAKTFVGMMNASFDRAGVVGFTTGARYITANGQYLSDGFAAVNGSIDALYPQADTNIAAGIEDGTVGLDFGSNASRDKVLVLLTDGQPTEPGSPVQAAREAAREANASDVTIYSVGFGDEADIDVDLMEYVANVTGGQYYHAADGDGLDAVFEDIFRTATESKHVVRDPVSMGLSTGASTVYPGTGGNESHIATGLVNGTAVLNVNDPTALGGYSYVFTVADSVNVSADAYAFNCTRWERTGRVYVNDSSGEDYREARCTAVEPNSTRTIPPSNATLYHDGDDVSALLSTSGAWWEENVSDVLGDALDGTTLDLASNEAIIVYDYPDDSGAANRLFVRYRIGRPTDAATYQRFLSLAVNEVSVS